MSSFSPFSATKKLAASAVVAALVVAGAAPDGALATDYLGVSGGGARACVTGLVFMDELAKQFPNLRVPAGQTQGLSGGAWSVMVAEAFTPEDALARYRKYLHKLRPDRQLGVGFNGLAAGSAPRNVWPSMLQWEKYVHSIIFSPLWSKDHDHTDTVYRKSHKARVLIGAVHTTTEQIFLDTHCLITATGTAADLTCSRRPPVELSSPPTITRLEQRDTPEGAWPLTRENQALATSSAWLAVAMKSSAAGVLGNTFGRLFVNHKSYALPFRIDDVTPYDAALRLENKRGPNTVVEAEPSNHFSLFDEGIVCNLPVTRQEMETAGVTLVVDASADAAYHESLEVCRNYWRTNTRFGFDAGGFGFDTREVTGERLANIKWMPGHILDLKRLQPRLPRGSHTEEDKYSMVDLSHLVRVVEFLAPGTGKPTGRLLVVVTFERLSVDGHLAGPDERFTGIETVGSILDKLPPVKLPRASFDLMDLGARRFFSEVFRRCLTMNGGTLPTPTVTDTRLKRDPYALEPIDNSMPIDNTGTRIIQRNKVGPHHNY